MGFMTLVGSIMNLESAEAAGDRFDTRSSLAVNGAGSIRAALFGSCFPTTLYIGHPGWKALGARTGYSTLNGLAVGLLCLTGSMAALARLSPGKAVIAILTLDWNHHGGPGVFGNSRPSCTGGGSGGCSLGAPGEPDGPSCR